MKHLRILLLIVLSLSLFGCPDKDEKMDSKLTIINQSDKELVMFARGDYYPDTIITIGNPWDKINPKFVIYSNSIYTQKVNWRQALAHPTSTDVMTIFLFDKAVVDTVPWKTIREDYLVAKRYEYTLAQLDSLNWTITYP